MKHRIQHPLLALALLSTLNLQSSTASAQGTAFNYQGRLNDNGSPASGIYDLRFAIYDSTNGPGVLIAGPVTNSTTAVTNGLFTVTLDFAKGVFPGPARWLQLDVRTNGSGAFTTLLPRQPILPTPSAILANTASNLLGPPPAAQWSTGTANASITGSAATATTVYPLTQPMALDQQPVPTRLEAVYALDNFNRSSNATFGGNVVVQSTVGSSVTKNSAFWSGWMAITNNALTVSNGFGGGLAIFASQTPATVGDFVCAKIISVSQGISNGVAYVGFWNTNGQISNNSRVALARYGCEVGQHFSIGFYLIDNTNTLSADVLKDVGDSTTIFALGVSLDATNIVTGWVQGGRFAQQYGAITGSDVWYPYFCLTNNSLANVVAGIASGDVGYSVDQLGDFRAMHNWKPNPRNLLLDFHQSGSYNGDHVPNVLRLPDQGLLVNWESGSNHGSPDLVLKAQYRSPSGRWYPAQTVLGPGSITNGFTNVYNSAACAIVTNSVWFIYDYSTNKYTSAVYYRLLTVTNGVISLGDERAFPFCGTNDGKLLYLNNNGIFQIPSGPYAGRYIFEWGAWTNNGGNPLGGRFARSDDGLNWTNSAPECNFSSPGETGIGMEPDGTLVAIQRRWNYLMRTTSTNGGATWATWTVCSNLPSTDARAMVHSFKNGLYAVAASQGPNARTNGIIYICDTGSTVVSTIPFGWYGGIAVNVVQYPDFIVDGDSVFTVWSEAPCGGIHAASLPLNDTTDTGTASQPPSAQAPLPGEGGTNNTTGLRSTP